MKINIRIGKLVLHGFNHHDHKRISTALEQELGRLIKKNGLPKGFVQEGEIRQIDAPSFNSSVDMNPKTIGAEVARSIYNTCRTYSSERIS